eukprot:3880597-Alexandrium_andersonii.AAC.1
MLEQPAVGTKAGATTFQTGGCSTALAVPPTSSFLSNPTSGFERASRVEMRFPSRLTAEASQFTN